MTWTTGSCTGGSVWRAIEMTAAARTATPATRHTGTGMVGFRNDSARRCSQEPMTAAVPAGQASAPGLNGTSSAAASAPSTSSQKRTGLSLRSGSASLIEVDVRFSSFSRLSGEASGFRVRLRTHLDTRNSSNAPTASAGRTITRSPMTSRSVLGISATA